ncbi:MAG TPA: hypothetical protein VFB65_21135 [Pyrinomonadaceae bacterium]|nr:hypothetical protein [Pyrinomonadaceae bacterium]
MDLRPHQLPFCRNFMTVNGCKYMYLFDSYDSVILILHVRMMKKTGHKFVDDTSPLNIGKSTYTTYYFGGLIDQVRISAATLYSSNFTAGLGPANNTRAFWKFDGQTSNDVSGNGNHGTLHGGATYSTDNEMTGFKPTDPAGEGGKTDDDRYNGVITIHDAQLGQTFNIVNDPTPPPAVKADLIARGARGSTNPQNPFWTYAYPKAGPGSRPGDRRYPELFKQITMDYVRVQVHETGAALSLIRNIYHPGPWASRLPDRELDPEHKDDGPALEDCVGRNYYSQMGLTPVLQK